MRRHNEKRRPCSRAILAARALQRMAGWRAEARSDLVFPSLPCLGYEPRFEALLFPAGQDVPVEAINSAVQELRCDALVIVADEPLSSPVRAHAVLRSKAIQEWHGPCRFWFSPVGDIWLAGATHAGSAEIAVSLVTSRLTLAAPPWRSSAELKLGLDLASALLAHVMEELR